MKNLQGQHVLVLGLGLSGLAQARWCARWGARVTVADTREAPPQLALLREQLPEVAFVGGPFTAELVQGQDAVFKSPGLSPADVAPVMDAARAAGLVVGNELSLFAQALHELAHPEPEQAEEVVPEEGPAAESAEGNAEVASEAVAAPAEPACAEAAELVTLEANQAAPSAEMAQQAPQAQADQAAQEAAALESGESSEAVVVAEALEAAEHAQAAEAAQAAELAAAAQATDSAPAPAEDDEPLTLIAPPPPPEPGYRPKVLAITGTNGKTTVTSLTGQLVQRAGKTVAVAGNIGPTLLDTLCAHLDKDELPEVWVLELSSFQLDEVRNFEPTAATVLNLSQDHLDWHGTMDAYAGAKAHIYGARGLMVLNREDPLVMAQLPPPVPVKGKPRAPYVRPHQTFGLDQPSRPGDWGMETVNGMTWLVRASEADETIKRKRGEEVELYVQRLMPVDALRIRGRHNASNALAALALATAAGCTMAAMLHGLREYRGEPHRVEPVLIIDGVEFFDDSKGTNVGATVAALNGLGAERRVVVILGGEGKGQDFSPLAAPLSRYGRAAVLIGRDAPQIREAVAGSGVPLLNASSMTEAVRMAFEQAEEGDAVLLSPACASFDMFDNYEHRARVFCEAVTDLAQEQGVVL